MLRQMTQEEIDAIPMKDKIDVEVNVEFSAMLEKLDKKGFGTEDLWETVLKAAVNEAIERYALQKFTQGAVQQRDGKLFPPKV